FAGRGLELVAADVEALVEVVLGPDLDRLPLRGQVHRLLELPRELDAGTQAPWIEISRDEDRRGPRDRSLCGAAEVLDERLGLRSGGQQQLPGEDDALAGEDVRRGQSREVAGGAESRRGRAPGRGRAAAGHGAVSRGSCGEVGESGDSSSRAEGEEDPCRLQRI